MKHMAAAAGLGGQKTVCVCAVQGSRWRGKSCGWSEPCISRC